MLYRVVHTCKDRDCRYRLQTLHNIITDSMKKSILNIAMSCPKCGNIMDSFPEEVPSTFIVEGKNTVKFIDYDFIRFRDGAINIYLDNIINSGFSGSVNIHTRLNYERFIFDSITNTIKKVK